MNGKTVGLLMVVVPVAVLVAIKIWLWVGTVGWREAWEETVELAVFLTVVLLCVAYAGLCVALLTGLVEVPWAK